MTWTWCVHPRKISKATHLFLPNLWPNSPSTQRYIESCFCIHVNQFAGSVCFAVGLIWRMSAHIFYKFIAYLPKRENLILLISTNPYSSLLIRVWRSLGLEKSVEAQVNAHILPVKKDRVVRATTSLAIKRAFTFLVLQSMVRMLRRLKKSLEKTSGLKRCARAVWKSNTDIIWNRTLITSLRDRKQLIWNCRGTYV